MSDASFELRWTLEIIQAQPRDPLWRFVVNLVDAAGERTRVVNWVQQPGESGPFVQHTPIGVVPSGRYYLDVTTCDYCKWVLAIYRSP